MFCLKIPTNSREFESFDKFIITATTPFQKEDCLLLKKDAGAPLEKYHPEYKDVFAKRGWKMFASLDRVYDNSKAQKRLGWQPKWDFAEILQRLKEGQPLLSSTAHQIGEKGYHN